jgi:hypothetical protein
LGIKMPIYCFALELMLISYVRYNSATFLSCDLLLLEKNNS